ncbi:MAG: hypothetical protein OEQ24_12795, partial [Gammaproteobacteria bacterium]|nr:hypothetical protein [Gammaproteobacteria bacterium]
MLCYFDINRKQNAYNLWDNGITAFQNATFYKEWDRIKTLDHQNLDELLPLIKDSITEKTRIITCFENFMKGHLLMQDILVHRVSNRHKSIQKQQEDRPIYVREVKDEDTF